MNLMKMKSCAAAAPALLFAALAAYAGSAPPATGERVDALLREQVAATAPGCAVGVARGDDVLHARGYGLANLDHGVAITPDTVFDVGSVTKQFTAASIVLLSLDGALALDDDIRTHLPKLPDYGPTITIDYLADHLEPAAEPGVPRGRRRGRRNEVAAVPSPIVAGDYEGSFYSEELDARYHVGLDDGALRVRIERWLPLDLIRAGGDRFTGIDFPAWTGPRRVELEFQRNARGAVTGFSLSAGQARDIEFVRLPDRAP